VAILATSVVAVLAPVGASASFNSLGNGPICSNYTCAFWIAAIVGIFGIPMSILMFWGLWRLSRGRHPGTPTPIPWVVANGAVAYVIGIGVLLLGPGRNVTWAWSYLGYAALFTLISAFVDRRATD
jgi:hypothetical protein